MIPDLVLAWNDTQKQEAMEVHNVPKENIIVTGSPFFDKWFEEKKILDREEFCQKVGIPEDKPFLLYLGSSENIAKDESWLIKKIADELQKTNDQRLKEMVILMRPHGSHQDVYRNLSHPKIKVWLRPERLPNSPESFSEFASGLFYSSCTVGLNTTGMVDALLADKPVVVLLVEEYSQTNAAQAIHFRYILNEDVYERAGSVREAASIVSRILNGEDNKRENRRKFVFKFVRPNGFEWSAGELCALAIEWLGQKKTISEIRYFMNLLKEEKEYAHTSR